VEKQLKTEDDLKNDIFNTFSEFCNETSSNLRIIYFERFCDKTTRWCEDYFFIKEKEEGIISVELWNALQRFINNENNVPKERNKFLSYLEETLNNVKNEYYNKREEKFIHISMRGEKKLRKIEKLIETRESYYGRKLSNMEEIRLISQWQGISADKARKLIDKMRMKDSEVVSLDEEKNDGMGNMHNLNLKSSFGQNISYDPIDELIAKTKNQDFRDVVEAVKSVIDKKQARSRDCYRALFTLYCINFDGIEKSKVFEKLYPLLDSKIIETWQKDMKKPLQYEIYQLYHPDASKETAENKASTYISNLLNDIKAYCERNDV
jgi:hypothetical protein